MYTVHLAKNPDIVFGYTPNNMCKFDHASVITPKQYVSEQAAKSAMRILYLDELQLPESHLVYIQEDYKWNLCYILSKSEGGKVTDHIKYYLQNDGSIAPEAGSTDARKFDSYDDAYRHMKQLGILMHCFCIPATTEDF